MRRPAPYPAPRYEDPNDLRLVRIIRAGKNAEPHAVNIIGVPFDGAVLGRRGAAEGPDAIRQAMSGFSNYNIELDVGLEDARIRDLGDVVVGPRVHEAHAIVQSEVSDAVRDDAMLVILGGDNSISLPALTSCAKKLGKVGLVVIDSHLDLRGEIEGKPTSGSSYGLAMERRVVKPKNVAEIGAHGFLNSRVYADRAKRLGVALFTAEEVSRRGARAVARDAYARASRGTDAVYVSFDLDAVDLAQVSGVSAPSAGGMWARNALVLLYELARMPRVRCADIVELAPGLDPTGGSQRVAAAALVYLVAGYQARTKEGEARKRGG